MGNLVIDHSALIETINPTFLNECFKHFSEGGKVKPFCTAMGISVANFMTMVANCRELEVIYEEARRDCTDVMVEELLEDIEEADLTTTITTKRGVVKDVLDHAKVAKLRVKADTVKWVVSKWSPRRYGDKIDISGKVEHTVESPLQQLRRVSGLDAPAEAPPSYQRPPIEVESTTPDPVEEAKDDPNYLPPLPDPNRYVVPEVEDGFIESNEKEAPTLKHRAEEMERLALNNEESRASQERCKARRARLDWVNEMFEEEAPDIDDLI